MSSLATPLTTGVKSAKWAALSRNINGLGQSMPRNKLLQLAGPGHKVNGMARITETPSTGRSLCNTNNGATGMKSATNSQRKTAEFAFSRSCDTRCYELRQK